MNHGYHSSHFTEDKFWKSKAWCFGLALGVGLFGIKTGLGLGYVFSRAGRPLHRWGLVFIAALLYLAAFLAMARVFSVLDVFTLYRAVGGVLASGMLIHLAMAVLLALWGISLLRRGETAAKPTAGWAALVFPCPVCLVMILFVTGFLTSWFPERSTSAVLFAYLIFVLAAGIALILSLLAAGKNPQGPERSLGAAMLAISGYFVLTVTVGPQAADMEKIYRLARYTAQDKGPDTTGLTWIALACGLFLLGGFAAQWITIRKETRWT